MTNLRLGLAFGLSILCFAAGCSSKDDGNADPYATGDPSNPQRTSDEAGAAPATSSTGKTQTGNPPAGDAGTKDGSATGDGGTDSGSSGGGAACLDDSAPAVQPACPGDGSCQIACDNFASDYKKGLSADIRKCLTNDICLGDTSTCSDKALAKACADPTSATFCGPLVTGCKNSNPSDTVTESGCELLARGLTASGRANLQSCFENETDCGGCLAKMR